MKLKDFCFYDCYKLELLNLIVIIFCYLIVNEGIVF